MPKNEIESNSESESQAAVTSPRRRRIMRRHLFKLVTALGIGLIVLSAAVVFLYRFGVTDSYIRSAFTAKLNYMGMAFDADVFRVRVSPFELELKNAVFNDRLTGARLFFIRDARIGLGYRGIDPLTLVSDIEITSADIHGAEIWVDFDQNGHSNFANLREDDRGSFYNFIYDSVQFALADSVIYFGDEARAIAANGQDLRVNFLPLADGAVPENTRYQIDIAAANSTFSYAENSVEDITFRATALAGLKGADITDLTIESPIGVSRLKGTVTEYTNPKYDIDIESSIDLTQTSNIFPLGAALRGVGNFKGKLTGEGEKYKINGQADSESIMAEGVYLKAANVGATVDGANSDYEANGTAVAEMLTFGDFRIDFPRLSGNVRGTGTDFRWLGELSAAAARSGSVSLGQLFLSDAAAEYRERQLSASAKRFSADRFSVTDSGSGDLSATGLKLEQSGDETLISAESARSRFLRGDGYSIGGAELRNVRARNSSAGTDLEIESAEAGEVDFQGSKLQNLAAGKTVIKSRGNSTEAVINGLRAERLDSNGAVISDIEAEPIRLSGTSDNLAVASDGIRVARIDAGGAILGSINVAGVRLTIRQGLIEGTTADIDAGDVELAKSENLAEGGKLNDVKIARPVFVLEPSGRYRATADMSLGGGMVGSVPLGAATAKVEVDDDKATLSEIAANVMEGRLAGTAAFSLSGTEKSRVDAEFTDLDLSKLVAVQAGRVIPLDGKTDGSVNISFSGTDIATASGEIRAAVSANAGNADSGLIPLNGRIELSANNGLFNVDLAKVNTEKSELNASGKFDLSGSDSNLDITIASTDAGEIDRMFRISGFAPEIEAQVEDLQVLLAGEMKIDGRLTGNLYDPEVTGHARLESISIRGRDVGSLVSDIFYTQSAFSMRSGVLSDREGGRVEFGLEIPTTGTDNISVRAKLSDVNAGNLIAALPVTIPERIRELTGRASGTVDIAGLPNQAKGEIDIAATSGTIAGQRFDNMKAVAVFENSRIDLRQGEFGVGSGKVSATGFYDRASTDFQLELSAFAIPLPLALAALPPNPNIPEIAGTADFTASGFGNFNRTSTYNFNFAGEARDVQINGTPFGESITVKGGTAAQVLTADLTAVFEGRPQVIDATVNFTDENLPFRFETKFDRGPLAPFFAFVPQLRGVPISGTASGNAEVAGNLSRLGSDGIRAFVFDEFGGTARFSELSLMIQDAPLVATEPVVINLRPKAVEIETARFSGGGSNITIAGVKAIADDGVNDLALDGRLNLGLVNILPGVVGTDTFFSGFANVSIRLAGVNTAARVLGNMKVETAGVSMFVGTERIALDRLQGNVLFTSNQILTDRITGLLGGGRVQINGGALFDGNLAIQNYRFEINGRDITVPLPADFITTGDATLEISGRSDGGILLTSISGNIRAKRSIYTKDIDISNIFAGRRAPSLSGTSLSAFAPRIDLTIDGRNALIVQNNIADLTASAALRVTGNADSPQISGRITANGGTLLFRNDRYQVQRGVLEFPPDASIEPTLSLQAESEIKGYQILVNLNGPLADTQRLEATVRSSPALPQADVVSLITTGNLSNTESGIPAAANTGINTAADILTDSIINNPTRRATDKLFGLNVFEIDPIISGDRLNPSARLTVGRQVNNNLRITYSTNLTEDQNQILAFEYRLSNKLSFVAQYEQRSLTNVTRNRDDFSFEIRLRRRF